MPIALFPLLLLAISDAANAGGGGPAAELLQTNQTVPPAVMFVLDLSAEMGQPCLYEDADARSPTLSTTSCLAHAVDVIKQIARHHDDLRIGVVGTAASADSNNFRKIVPLGTEYGDLATALDALTVNTTSTRNLAELLSRVSRDYFRQTSQEDWVDDDGDGYDGDWAETPFSTTCSTVHTIVLSRGLPVSDDKVKWWASTVTPPNDVSCDTWGYGDDDDECLYDDVVYHVYRRDHSSLAGTQNVAVSTIGLGLDPSVTDEATAESLFDNSADIQNGDGIYTNADDLDEAVAGVLNVLADVVTGVYSRSSPIVTNSGTSLVSTFYELSGDNPLAQGHVRSYGIDVDPVSSSYGELVYNSGSPYDDYDGAAWDAGWLLYERPASAAEKNEDDRDGLGARDVYFYDETLALAMPADAEDGRLSFDAEFVAAMYAGGLLSEVLDDRTDALGNSVSPEFNLDKSADGRVDLNDLQTLVDFTRGVATTEFRYLDAQRGAWKLQDSPYSHPVAVTERMSFSAVSTHRTFQRLIEKADLPEIVLVAANDGMLHAFALDDDADTPDDNEAGRELWAWIPSPLILRTNEVEWEAGLVDAMWYGRTWLFDGTPVVQDVWIDEDNDGERDCGDSLDDCEWHRVALVQQGFGGTHTLALDISRANAPKFLWEQTNTEDRSAMGYTTSRPVVFNVRDASDPAAEVDRWIALWGGGRPAEYSSQDVDYYKTAEGSLYAWAVGDDAFVGGAATVAYASRGANVGDAHPDADRAALLDLDSDGKLEYTYISAPPAVVDVDADGAADVAYVALSLAYDPEAATLSTQNPGHSYIYKAIFDEADPANPTWCMFYDPYVGAPNTDAADGAAIPYGSRPEVYYGLTTSWLGDGGLGVYWGTGSPFLSESTSTAGAFFFLRDPEPGTCGKAEAITCGTQKGGFYQLKAGERLTNDPVAHAGVVYFTTYEPDADACTLGSGRLYGLDYETCAPGLDTNGDGMTSTLDAAYVEAEGYISNVAVGATGELYYAPSNAPEIRSVSSTADPFHGTAMVGWMEIY